MSESMRVSGVRVLNCAHMTGVSKTSGNPYDMVKVSYLAPSKDYEKADASFKRLAFGYEVKDANAILDDALFAKFSSLVYLEPCDIFIAPHPDDFTKMLIVDVEQKPMLVTSVAAAPAPSPAAKNEPEVFGGKK